MFPARTIQLPVVDMLFINVDMLFILYKYVETKVITIAQKSKDHFEKTGFAYCAQNQVGRNVKTFFCLKQEIACYKIFGF